MIMEGETHKRYYLLVMSRRNHFGPYIISRQRRALSYAFSISAIRDLSPVFFDTAYRVRLVRCRSLVLISLAVAA
jgi:hypothetical protein